MPTRMIHLLNNDVQNLTEIEFDQMRQCEYLSLDKTRPVNLEGIEYFMESRKCKHMGNKADLCGAPNCPRITYSAEWK